MSDLTIEVKNDEMLGRTNDKTLHIELIKKGKEIERLNNIISEANKILSGILVIKDREHKGRYRPIKNTSSQDVYKAIIMLNELFETPCRANYGLLQGSDKE